MATIDEFRMRLDEVRSRRSDRGPTITEYILTAALIAIVLYSLYTTLTGHGA
jgi:Flp pilus assembly pilin Flp